MNACHWIHKGISTQLWQMIQSQNLDSCNHLQSLPRLTVVLVLQLWQKTLHLLSDSQP